MDDAGDNAPHLQFLTVLQFDGGVIWIFGEQLDLACPLVQSLDGESAVDDGDHDSAMHGIQGTIDHQQIIVLNAGTDHGVSFGAHEEGRFAVPDQVFVEIERVTNVIVRRAGKTSPNGMREERQPNRLSALHRAIQSYGVSGHGALTGIDADASVGTGACVDGVGVGRAEPETGMIPSHSEQIRQRTAPELAKSSVCGSMGLRQ